MDNSQQPSINSIAAIRYDLVGVRAALANVSAELVTAKAVAEQRAIDAPGGDEKKIGANETARARALIIALADDLVYQETVQRYRNLAEAVERTEAVLEEAIDVRREREWAIRLRLAEALDGKRVTSDRHERINEDAFDDAATEQALQEVEPDDMPF